MWVGYKQNPYSTISTNPLGFTVAVLFIASKLFTKNRTVKLTIRIQMKPMRNLKKEWSKGFIMLKL